jgi:hypothetical protein
LKNTIPTGRLLETQAEIKASLKRHSRLRAIDQGTPYDATGRMVKWLRELRSGKLGRCTDVLMVARVIIAENGEGTGGPAYEHFKNGISGHDVHRRMAEVAMERHKIL